jgi:hypothetical protein
MIHAGHNSTSSPRRPLPPLYGPLARSTGCVRALHPQSRPTHRRAGEPAVIIPCEPAHPAFVALAGDEGLAGLALCLQRIEFLVESLLRGFASVNGTANPWATMAPPKPPWRKCLNRVCC